MATTGEKRTISVDQPDRGYERFVKRIVDLPTIPHILMKIWKLVESPDSSSADLEKVISLDQALTAKVIRLANSPFYHTSNQVSSLRDAVVNIGFAAVRNLAVTVTVTSIFKKQKGANRYFPLKDFWRHCVGVGVTARTLAGKVAGIDTETCMCGGILHDIGKFVLNLLFPREFAEALDLAAREKILIREAEMKVFSADHSTFGESFARHWSFSEELASMIGEHHKPFRELDPEYLRQTAVITLADSMVRKLRIGFPGDFITGEIDREAAEMCGLSVESIEGEAEQVLTRIRAASELLNIV